MALWEKEDKKDASDSTASGIDQPLDDKNDADCSTADMDIRERSDMGAKKNHTGGTPNQKLLAGLLH